MSKKAGRDNYTLLLALTTAYLAFTRLPNHKQPRMEMGTIRGMIREFGSDGMTSLMFAEIVMKLNPGASFDTVCELFGIQVEQMQAAS